MSSVTLIAGNAGIDLESDLSWRNPEGQLNLKEQK